MHKVTSSLQRLITRQRLHSDLSWLYRTPTGSHAAPMTGSARNRRRHLPTSALDISGTVQRTAMRLLPTFGPCSVTAVPSSISCELINCGDGMPTTYHPEPLAAWIRKLSAGAEHCCRNDRRRCRTNERRQKRSAHVQQFVTHQWFIACSANIRTVADTVGYPVSTDALRPRKLFGHT